MNSGTIVVDKRLPLHDTSQPEETETSDISATSELRISIAAEIKVIKSQE